MSGHRPTEELLYVIKLFASMRRARITAVDSAIATRPGGAEASGADDTGLRRQVRPGVVSVLCLRRDVPPKRRLVHRSEGAKVDAAEEDDPRTSLRLESTVCERSSASILPHADGLAVASAITCRCSVLQQSEDVRRGN